MIRASRTRRVAAVALAGAMLAVPVSTSGAGARCVASPVTSVVRERAAREFERHFDLPLRSVIWSRGHFGRCGSTRWAMAFLAGRAGVHLGANQRSDFQDGPWAFRGTAPSRLRYAGDGVGDLCASRVPPRAMLHAWRETCETGGRRVRA